MKGSQVHNLYPNSNFKNFNGYTCHFEFKIFQILRMHTVPESQIAANLDFFGLFGAFEIKMDLLSFI